MTNREYIFSVLGKYNQEHKKNLEIMKKLNPIIPNLPSREKLIEIIREGRKSRLGRPPKWNTGERMRLQTRVSESTHDWLMQESKLKKVCIGEIIDDMVKRRNKK